MTLSFTITEIFASIQGESSFAGLPCTFIRLTGCPLRCNWCDTAYGFENGTLMSADDILGKVNELSPKIVEFTGGEPLGQSGVPALMKMFVEKGYQVLLETSGAVAIDAVPQEAHIIMDIKCPGSGMDSRNLWPNLDYLKASDEIKFVIASYADFEWALNVVHEFNLEKRFKLLFSPAWGLVKEKDLSAWVLDSGIDCRLNLQLHKYIWGPRVKGV
ncbi:MAG: radical SAM protein [Bdellovibrionota bacterium]